MKSVAQKLAAQLKFRFLARWIVVGAISLVGFALAHSTVVLGTLTTTPQLAAGEPFTLHIELRDPTGLPIEDARVKAEFTEQEGTAAAITANFKEVAPGNYETTVTLPAAGNWQLLLRDQTFEYEEATATVALQVGADMAQPITFEFPKTTPPRGFSIWLIALIVAPILFAAVLTVRVLTGKAKTVPSEA